MEFVSWLVHYQMVVGNHAPYSTEVTERIRLGNAGGPGIRMQFKSPAGRNLSLDNPLEKNVSQLIPIVCT